MTPDRPSEAPAPETQPAPAAPPPGQAELQELAEDMVNVLERLNTIERQTRETIRALDSLRRDLIGDRRALAARGVLDALAPAQDAIASLREGLDRVIDRRADTQLGLAASVIAIALQSLGFERLEVVPGEEFRPDRMECLGYAEGEPGRVLDVVRAGYCSGDVVVRPAGVLIADPQAKSNSPAAPDGAGPAEPSGE